jgi:hypothetical protein
MLHTIYAVAEEYDKVTFGIVCMLLVPLPLDQPD